MNIRPPRSLGELLSASGLPAGLSGAALDVPVTAVVCDSRRVTAGALFVALPGHTTAGHLYVEEAIRRGCSAVVAERGRIDATWPVPGLPVDDPQQALLALAAAWYGHPARSLHCIGITGTNGKTTSTWLIEGLLVQAGLCCGVIGTVDYRWHDASGVHVLQKAALTTPDVLTLQALLRQMVDAGATHLVMELSSHALDQGRVGGLAFDVAVFTNLTRDHLDYHGDMARYFAAKKRLFTEYLAPGGTAVIDVDAPGDEQAWGERLAAGLGGIRVLRTGLDPRCDVGAEAIEYGFSGFNCMLRACGERVPLHSPLVGAYNVRNVLGAVGVGLALNLPLPQICAGIANVRVVPGRLERVVPKGDSRLFPAVFVDYAHTPDALDNVLRTLRLIRKSGRIFCVFGCGGDRDKGKRPLMGQAAARLSDRMLATSDNPRTEDPEAILDAVIPGLEQAGAKACAEARLFAASQPGPCYARVCDRRRAIALACGLAGPEDIVLIAGKGHEDYQICGTEKQYCDDRVLALDALTNWNGRLLLAALKPVGAAVVAQAEVPRLLGRVSTDSRQLAAGDIFVALKGERFDGHDFIGQALAAGAGAVIGEAFPESALTQRATLCLRVEDSLAALGALAAFRRQLFAGSLRVAAITGSSGKTTVKEMVAAICENALRDGWANTEPVLKTCGNFNNLIGLPLSLLPLHAGHRVAVMEMGMSAPGEIAALTGIADPDLGCINTVHPAHLQGLGSLAGVAAAKGELFQAMRPEAVRVVNEDDPRIWRIAEASGGSRIGFALTEAGLARHPLVSVRDLENLGPAGLRFTLHIGSWHQRIDLPALGEHNAHNAAAAAAIAVALGITPENIALGLARYRPLERRLALRKLPGGLQVLNDVYNANPASMAAGLRTLAALATTGGRTRSVAVLGDMLELGADSARLHREIGELAAALHLDWLAVSGGQAEEIAAAAQEAGMAAGRVLVFAAPAEIGLWCAGLFRSGRLEQGDWIFVKGSRGMHMEGFIEELERQLSGEAHAL